MAIFSKLDSYLLTDTTLDGEDNSLNPNIIGRGGGDKIDHALPNLVKSDVHNNNTAFPCLILP